MQVFSKEIRKANHCYQATLGPTDEAKGFSLQITSIPVVAPLYETTRTSKLSALCDESMTKITQDGKL